MKTKLIFHIILLLSITFSACESEEVRQRRLARKEQQKIEHEEKQKAEDAKHAYKMEQERKAYQARLEKERQEKAIYNKYINNSLSTGTTPYAYCFGSNKPCSEWGCSEIKVKTPYNSDVLVTIKKGGKVVRHAYIKSSSSYTFELPDGTYQTFFYYGKGWNPDKVMKQTYCGTLKGGFVAHEDFGKDSPQTLSNNILEYELILQQNGNFSTRPSNANEAF